MGEQEREIQLSSEWSRSPKEGVYRIEELFPTEQNISDAQKREKTGWGPFLAVVYVDDGRPAEDRAKEVGSVFKQFEDGNNPHYEQVVVPYGGNIYQYVAVGDRPLPGYGEHYMRYVALDGGDKIEEPFIKDITRKLIYSLKSILKQKAK